MILGRIPLTCCRGSITFVFSYHIRICIIGSHEGRQYINFVLQQTAEPVTYVVAEAWLRYHTVLVSWALSAANLSQHTTT